MSGFVSTSLDKAQAIEFAVKDKKPEKLSILQEIIWKRVGGHLRLDSKEWTAYRKE